MPLVSVIMPYYKKESFIKKSVLSIIRQSFKNFEIIIIDDELSNSSQKILKEINKIDKRIKILKNSKNLGAGLSRNKGIKVSRGKYIAFCDCDDLWSKAKLQYQIKFMQKKKIEFCYTAYGIIDKMGNRIGLRKANNKINFESLVKSCDIGLSSVILKKRILKNLNFAETKTKEDYILWLKLAQRGVSMYGLNKKLYLWRKLDYSLSSSSIQKILDGYRVYRTYLKYNIFRSFLCLFILSFNSLLKR
jgi:teichuronic acid biosynthesis glycosyltransferase TuaG